MTNLEEYSISGDYNQFAVVMHINCQEEAGGDYFDGPTFENASQLLEWILNHSKKCIREADSR